MSIELNTISSGYSTGLINDNFQKLEDYIKKSLLNRDGTVSGEPNQMELDLDMNSNRIYNLPEAISDLEPVQKRQLDIETEARIAADTLLQGMISGGEPLEASAFSPISWHKQSVDISLTIPADKNAWSFGPEIEIAVGQVVTIETGSFWTIANGQVVS